MSAPPDNAPKGKVKKQNGSSYGSLDPKLLAKITLVDKKGNSVHDAPKVFAIMTDGEFELGSQYNSPFENQNPDQRFSTLAGMLQSGDLVPSISTIGGGIYSWLKPVGDLLGDAGDAVLDTARSGSLGVTSFLLAKGIDAFGEKAAVGTGTVLRAGAKSVTDTLSSLEGRTTLSKVNSTQIFVSTTPVKISCTLFFRAWANAYSEVEQQIQRLQEWTLPQKLSKTGVITSLAQKFELNSLFPSIIPPFVSLTYGGLTYTPLFLESVSTPLVVERDKNGNRLAASVTCSFVSRQAWDKTDVRKLYKVGT